MVSESQQFHCADGKIFTSLLDLYVQSPDLSDQAFEHHVTPEKNDFSRWVRDVFFDNAFADKLQSAKTKTAFLKVIKESIRLPILVFNAGSSSVKFRLFFYPQKTTIIKGKVEAIALPRCSFEFSIGKINASLPVHINNHDEAVALILQTLTEHKIIRTKDEIVAVGHRVVHGGEYYHKATSITEEVIKRIEELAVLAPLHNPANLAGIYAVGKEMPSAHSIAVFDTAFHSTIPTEAFLYGLPYELYEKFKIRKYGFHGINHEYLAGKAEELLGVTGKARAGVKPKTRTGHKIITCHLGNGSSITAIKNRKSIDTSMGFTPLDGLIMGTRSGELDPDIVLYLLKEGHYSVEELEKILNNKSGLFGVSGFSADFRDLREAANLGNKKAKLAIEMLSYRVALFIGSYAAALDGVDAIVFSGGMGENAGDLRKNILDRLTFLGLKVDAAKNKHNSAIISTPRSKIKLLVIPANEEQEIADETWALLMKKP